MLIVAEEEAERAGEDVQPRVTLMGDEPGLTRSENVLEDLNPTGIPSQRYDQATARMAIWLEVRSGVTGRRRTDNSIQRHSVRLGQRDEQIECRLASAGLESGQRTHRQSRPLGDRGQGQPARGP